MADELAVTRPSPIVEKDLYAAAYCNGNANTAAKMLGRKKEAVQGSLKRHPRRYAEICDEVEPERRQRLAAQAEDALAVAIDGISEGVDLVREDIKELDPKERHTALRNLATTGALLNDKMVGPMRNRPTQVIRVEKSSPAELWAEFQAMFPGVMDSPVQDTEFVDESTEAPALTEAPDS